MIRMLVALVLLSVMIGLFIYVSGRLSKRQRWQLTKIAAVSIISAALAVGLLTTLVILF
jgi:cytochrome bd-type quinol oxidase subunit 1